MSERTFNKGVILLRQGNIVEVEADAIVNAANSGLMGGGGVDGAIHRAGGPDILEECKKIRQIKGICPPGNAVLTTAGRLKAKYVIHTVGPIWRGGNSNEANILRAAYLNSLEIAAIHSCQSVAFPSISTGAYSYPVQAAAAVALTACKDFLLEDSGRIMKITFVLFSTADWETYNKILMAMED